jgi:hypothetical protein
VVLVGYLNVRLVADVMLNGRPDMLKGSTYLQLKVDVVNLWDFLIVETGMWNLANVMKRIVSETIHFVALAFVNRVCPVDIKNLFCNGCYAVNIFIVESYYTYP